MGTLSTLGATLWYPVTLWYYRNDQLCNTCNADTQIQDRFIGGKPPNVTSSILKCLWTLLTFAKMFLWWAQQMTKYFRDGIFCCVDTYQTRFGISDTLTNCKHIFSFASSNTGFFFSTDTFWSSIICLLIYISKSGFMKWNVWFMRFCYIPNMYK